MSKSSILFLVLSAFSFSGTGRSAPAAAAIQTGPAVGSAVPDFEAVDQNGHTQTLRSTLGKKGALLVFYRSADW